MNLISWNCGGVISGIAMLLNRTEGTGTVLQAQREGSLLAVLVVHEFKTNSTDENKHLQNHIELEKLLCVLSGGSVINVDVGILYDEFNIDGMDFMIGKIITEL